MKRFIGFLSLVLIVGTMCAAPVRAQQPENLIDLDHPRGPSYVEPGHHERDWRLKRALKQLDLNASQKEEIKYLFQSPGMVEREQAIWRQLTESQRHQLEELLEADPGAI